MTAKNILLIYGSGGHNEQMARLFKQLKEKDKLNEFNFLSLCDNDVKHILTENYITTPTITDKFSYLKLIIKLPKRVFSILKICKKIKKEFNPDFCISTGPGLCIISSLYFKLFTKTKIIHIETWSRFYTKSLTGRFLYKIADYFFIQNTELLNVYPKAKFSGRL